MKFTHKYQFTLILLLSALILTFCLIPCSAVKEVTAAGGEADDATSLLAALGGEAAGWINDAGEVCLRADITLETPVRITGGSITLKGASSVITGRSSLFEVSGGTLIFGSNDNRDRDETIILEGGSDSMIIIDGGCAEIYAGTLMRSGSAELGGAIRLTAGKLLLSGGLIRECTASENGGGIFISGGEAQLGAAKIAACSAKRGGGIYIDGGKVTFSSVVIGSEAVHDEISSSISYVEEDGCNALCGGGVCINSGSFEIQSAQVCGNAAEQGGGFSIGEEGEVVFGQCECYYNRAELGGGIFNAGTAVDIGTVAGYNEAETGGGIYNIAGGEKGFYLCGGYVNSNKAVLGGGVFNAGYFEFTDGLLNYNESQRGGGLYNAEEGHALYSGGSPGYNKILIEDGSSAEKLSSDIFNAGRLVLSDTIFFGGTGNIALLDKPIELSGPFTTTTKIARIYAVSENEAKELVPDYTKGRQLLVNADESADKSDMKYYVTLFDVPDDETGGAWVIGANGTLRTAPLGIWVWIIIALFGAAIIGAAVYTIITKKKTSSK